METNLKSVHPRQPDQISPRQIPAVVIVSDVYGLQIPILVEEEVEDVKHVQESDDDHGVSDVTKLTEE